MSGGDLLGEGREARDDAVAEDVGGELGDVGRDDVAAAAEQRQRPGGMDQVDRAAGARAVGDVGLELALADEPGSRVAVVRATA